MGNDREMEKWAFSFITALHALFVFSNTFWSGLPSHAGNSGEEVEHMHDQLNTQKIIIDSPECCGCMTSHLTGRAELVYGLEKLVEQLF